MATVISGDTGVSQVQDGVIQTADIAAEAVNFSKMLQSEWGNNLATSGYQKLPSGLIIQWGLVTVAGSATSGTGSYPIAFPSVCLSATANRGTTTVQVTGDYVGLDIITNPTTSIKIIPFATSGGDRGYRYIAIGY